MNHVSLDVRIIRYKRDINRIKERGAQRNALGKHSVKKRKKLANIILILVNCEEHERNLTPYGIQICEPKHIYGNIGKIMARKGQLKRGDVEAQWLRHVLVRLLVPCLLTGICLDFNASPRVYCLELREECVCADYIKHCDEFHGYREK